MKKFIVLLGVVLLSIAMVGCKKDKEAEDNFPPVPTDIALEAEFLGIAKDTDVYFTTVGQSDLAYVENILKLAGISPKTTNTEGEVTGSYISKANLTVGEVVKTGENKPVVFMVVGGSSKGLGGAGTDINAETRRGAAFASASGEAFTLVVVHVGGEARRGSLTDPILDAVCPSADLMIVLESGNNDRYFSNSADVNNVNLHVYSTSLKIVDAFKALFAVE